MPQYRSSVQQKHAENGVFVKSAWIFCLPWLLAPSRRPAIHLPRGGRLLAS